MKLNKRLFIVLSLVLVACFDLVGCKKKKQEETSNSATSSSEGFTSKDSNELNTEGSSDVDSKDLEDDSAKDSSSKGTSKSDDSEKPKGKVTTKKGTTGSNKSTGTKGKNNSAAVRDIIHDKIIHGKGDHDLIVLPSNVKLTPEMRADLNKILEQTKGKTREEREALFKPFYDKYAKELKELAKKPSGQPQAGQQQTDKKPGQAGQQQTGQNQGAAPTVATTQGAAAPTAATTQGAAAPTAATTQGTAATVPAGPAKVEAAK